jgi:hypothetical protein
MINASEAKKIKEDVMAKERKIALAHLLQK